jgi:hypothetical protein
MRRVGVNRSHEDHSAEHEMERSSELIFAYLAGLLVLTNRAS